MSTGVLSNVVVSSSRFSADLYTEVQYCAHLTQEEPSPKEEPEMFPKKAKAAREITGAGIERKWKYTLRAFQPRREAPE